MTARPRHPATGRSPAGMVTVADGSKEMKIRLERVLTNDPGTGIARHADARYEEAIKFANEKGIKIPMLKKEEKPKVIEEISKEKAPP